MQALEKGASRVAALPIPPGGREAPQPPSRKFWRVVAKAGGSGLRRRVRREGARRRAKVPAELQRTRIGVRRTDTGRGHWRLRHQTQRVRSGVRRCPSPVAFCRRGTPRAAPDKPPAEAPNRWSRCTGFCEFASIGAGRAPTALQMHRAPRTACNPCAQASPCSSGWGTSGPRTVSSFGRSFSTVNHTCRRSVLR